MPKVTIWTETVLQIYIFKELCAVSVWHQSTSQLWKTKGREEKECPDSHFSESSVEADGAQPVLNDKSWGSYQSETHSWYCQPGSSLFPLPHHRAFVLLPEACPQATSSFLIKQLLCQWQQWLSPTSARGVAFCNTIWPPLARVSSI